MNATKKKYKSGGSKKKFLGGTIGTVVGGVAGSIIPGVGTAIGAKVGGALGSGIEGLVKGKPEAPAPPPEPIEYAASSYGYAKGGFLSGFGKNMIPKGKKATGGKVDSGGRQFKKKSDISYNDYSDPMVSQHMKSKELKGGKAKPIGQDAVEFEGQSHEQGGIELDSNNEVEGNETMDNIQGEGYVFSKRVKVPGTYKTFADVHKEMVSNNANPADIQQLAKLQEQVTGRE